MKTREIKFRVWHKQLKSLHHLNGFIKYGEGWGYKTGGDHLKFYEMSFGERGFMKVLESDIEMMQFSGLLDKNDKEIYEGDIIRSLSSYNQPIIHSIIWDDDSVSFRAAYQSGNSSMSKKWIDEFQKEVIGNIYEHSDLLK